MRVEAFGHQLGRDPVGKGHQLIAGQLQSFVAHQLQQRRSFLAQGLAIGVVAIAVGCDQRRLARGIRQQQAAFLEGLPDRRHPQRRLFGGQSFESTAMGMQDRIVIGAMHLAARKHQRAARKINLLMTQHHEYFQALPAITQQHDGGGGFGDRTAHGILLF